MLSDLSESFWRGKLGERGRVMMKLDHVVYFTKKAPLEVVWEQKELGWHTVMGGSHEEWGTYNALMYVNNAYIEWLALENERVAKASDNPLIKLYLHDRENNEGWGTICFSVEGIEDFNERLVQQGYQTSGVLNAQRKTTSGEIKRWKMLFIEQEPSDQLPYPFFIEWEIAESERFESLRADGSILQANEQLEVTTCLFNVHNAPQVVKAWQQLLGVEKTEDTVIELSNCTLQFSEQIQNDEKERLIDVAIEHRESM